MSPPGTSPLAAAETADDAANHAMRWWILAVLGVAQLMVILDNTVVNIALPTAQHALGFSNADRQWVVTAYSLAFGSLLLLGGRIGDIFGRKRTLIIGLAGFAGASAIGGASVNFRCWLPPEPCRAPSARCYLVGRAITPANLQAAALHSYTAAFLYSSLIFVVAAVIAGLVLPRGNMRALSGPAPDGTSRTGTDSPPSAGVISGGMTQRPVG